MSWTSLLPQSGDRLASWEWWLWVATVSFAVLAPASGLVAYQIGQYRGRLERAAAEREESMRRSLEAARRPVPRHITPAQRDKMVTTLSGKKGAKVVIAYVVGDSDGQRFALEIAEILRASGWDVEGPGGGNWTPNNPVGRGLVVKDANNPPTGAIFLWGAFTDAGIQMGALAKPETPADQIWIIVGIRA